jgi:hypothetical protein
MKQKDWEESLWIKNLNLVTTLPFEDWVFSDVYRSVLLRNVEFCEVVTVEDRVSCIRMTNKFIRQAIFTAFGIHNKEVSIIDVLKNILNDYDKEKSYYFFYIVYQELLRRNNPLASVVLSELRIYEFIDPFKIVFKNFDSKLAWDFLLLDLAHQGLNEDMFNEMWFRYEGTLLQCESNVFSGFVYKHYLKELKDPINLIKYNPKKKIYSFILKRAEERYKNKELF